MAPPLIKRPAIKPIIMGIQEEPLCGPTVVPLELAATAL